MALIHFNESSFDEALQSQELMMVDFWATWCGPCKMLGPVIEQLAEEYENVTIGKVDVDECPALAQRFGIMSVPTVIFFKNGEEIDRKIGAMPPTAYSDILDDNQ